MQGLMLMEGLALVEGLALTEGNIAMPFIVP